MAWLAWLARAMQANGQTVFHVDRLQPAWLPDAGRRRLVPAAATAAAVVAHLVLTALPLVAVSAVVVRIGSPPPPAGELLGRLAPAWLLALAGGAALALAIHDRAIEPIGWSSAAFRRALPAMGVRGALVGPPLGVTIALLIQPSGLSPALLGPAALALPVGIAAGVGFAIAAGVQFPSDAAPAAPGRDLDQLRRTARMGALAGPLVVCPPVALVCALALRFLPGHVAPLLTVAAALFAAFPVALLTALRFGGTAYMRHRILLWLLWRDGLAARDVTDFLAYAARLNLLRRQGGGYEFVHPLLRQYFAELAALPATRAPRAAQAARAS
jgi:hypothetical protein